MRFSQLKFIGSIWPFFGLIALTYLAFRLEMPGPANTSLETQTGFSPDRAMAHVQEISKTAHGVGYPGHEQVQDYIVKALNDLELKVSLQSGYTAGDWGNLCKATNILARIPGKSGNKALVILSHYDSSPHSSRGASDAGSGVAVILEGLRAYLSRKITPENDLILLFTDAEELGLNGAELFVREHPWAQEAGLVLNFEARGSGGPGYMLIETNGGNANLVSAFSQANPRFPVANSLAYSIYKMLPNDTDLTVFRSLGDIPGYNFAFIDDHFDYHTALDRFDRLDRNTLIHQGSYLMSLLSYFSDSDLTQLKSEKESVYFSVPIFGLIHYPDTWSWPLYFLAVLLFAAALVYGIKQKKITLNGLAVGFLPVFSILLLNGILGYFFWPALKSVYPAYTDLLHGFTYNGYWYIAVVVSLSLGNSFFMYGLWRRLHTTDALIAPASIWILLCGILTYYLPGAAFFIVPGFALLAMLWIRLLWSSAKSWIYLLFSVPALWIFSPFVKLFPVGLGLKFLIAASLLTSFIFLLISGVMLELAHRKRLAVLGWVTALFLIGIAHVFSNFTPERPKPSSLVYLWDADSNQARWASYDKITTSWNSPYLDGLPTLDKPAGEFKLSSKYGTGFTTLKPAPKVTLNPPEIRISKDTVIDTLRHVAFQVLPQRSINRVELFCSSADIASARVNGIPLTAAYLAKRREKLVTHYVSNNEATTLELSFSRDQPLQITIVEAATDLIQHPELQVPQRPDTEIPMPFVLNDAVVILKKIYFE